jgi:hypothetical protein
MVCKPFGGVTSWNFLGCRNLGGFGDIRIYY